MQSQPEIQRANTKLWEDLLLSGYDQHGDLLSGISSIWDWLSKWGRPTVEGMIL